MGSLRVAAAAGSLLGRRAPAGRAPHEGRGEVPGRPLPPLLAAGASWHAASCPCPASAPARRPAPHASLCPAPPPLPREAAGGGLKATWSGAASASSVSSAKAVSREGGRRARGAGGGRFRGPGLGRPWGAQPQPRWVDMCPGALPGSSRARQRAVGAAGAGGSRRRRGAGKGCARAGRGLWGPSRSLSRRLCLVAVCKTQAWRVLCLPPSSTLSHCGSSS